MDELLPLQQSGKNSFAGMGATLLDSLSTLWLMDLKDEFALGRAWVATNLTFASITVVCSTASILPTILLLPNHPMLVCSSSESVLTVTFPQLTRTVTLTNIRATS
jgi:hypothetical protein